MSKSVTPTQRKYTILKQLCEHIPAYLAREHGVISRGHRPWSHVATIILKTAVNKFAVAARRATKKTMIPLCLQALYSLSEFQVPTLG